LEGWRAFRRDGVVVVQTMISKILKK
jgi:hypothetical protein